MRRILSIALGGSLFAAAVITAQDWGQWRGPARTGVAASFTPPSRWPARPTRAWQAAVGVGHASPVVSSQRVFTFSRLGEQEAVTAFDLSSGRQLWQQRYDAPYQINPAAESHGKGPKSTPVVAGSRLFTFGINGTLSAFETGTGKVLWQKQSAREFDASSPDFGVAMSPLVDGDRMIVHVGGNKSGALTALDAASGSPRWQWKGDGPAYASPVVATVGGMRQVITQSRSRVVGLSAADGSLLWSVPFTTAYDQNSVTPVVAGDLVIYSGIERALTAVRITHTAGAWSAVTAWTNDAVPMYMSTPVLAGAHLFGLTHRNKGQFFCVDAQTGKTLWTTRGREGENAALISAGEVMLASTTEGELVVWRRDPARFDEIKRYTVADSPIWAHPVPAGGGLLIKDAEKLTYWKF